jgi:hypothetical protein
VFRAVAAVGQRPTSNCAAPHHCELSTDFDDRALPQKTAIIMVVLSVDFDLVGLYTEYFGSYS